MNLTVLQVLTYLVWLVGSITFILALKFLASPRTARRGNLLGAAGMTLVVAWTLIFHDLTTKETPGLLANWWVLVIIVDQKMFL